ncbi:hypothetical protein [Pantoea sp. AMG 501]|uniref:hypothetical protein n=1 Tax=Pantoea sp. AMG 501 TaxID=2008894 RepID=UPI000B5A7EC8|nr:hypothetical protein [Pantoea sp. AMG 501]OWY74552.1 hypothetical protein CDN97_22885 [Pantoea sp. AMG 501]
MKLTLTLNALLLTGGLFAGTAQADTLADTEADCRMEHNELKCTVLSEVKPAGITGSPGGRTVRINIPLVWGQWASGGGTSQYTYPKITQESISVKDGQGQDVSARCPLSVSMTNWTHSKAKSWVGVNEQSDGYPALANRVWWAGALTRTGDISRCPSGELTVRWRFTPSVRSHFTGNSWGNLPPVQADFRVLNTKHVSLRVPPVVGLSLSNRGAEGAGVIMLQRWGDVSMEVTRADDGGEPSLNSPSGTTTVPLEITLDTLSGRRNVAKGSLDNVIRWDGRAGENGYRLNISTRGNVKQTLTGEPGTWRSTLRVTVNAL